MGLNVSLTFAAHVLQRLVFFFFTVGGKGAEGVTHQGDCFGINGFTVYDVNLEGFETLIQYFGRIHAKGTKTNAIFVVQQLEQFRGNRNVCITARQLKSDEVDKALPGI